jgi:small subunit ribosomal protein S8
MHSDPIADLLTRIRNAASAKHLSLVVPYSRIKTEILEIMKRKEVIADFKVEKGEKFQEIKIELLEGKKANLVRASKPGQRIYLKKDEIKTVKSNLGFSIVSTSKGLMTNTEARKQGLGGEIICVVS